MRVTFPKLFGRFVTERWEGLDFSSFGEEGNLGPVAQHFV